MNHCLRVSEVVSTVYAFLQPKHALDLALTCRTLLEPGLDEIWRDIQSFDPLIACMPEDLWREEFAPDEHEQLGCKVLFLRRELKREDLDNYLTRYAKRVRFFSLNLKGGSRVLSGEALHALALVMDFRPGIFAPLLKQFGWPCDLDLQYFFGESVSRSLPPHMPLFLGEQTTRIHITLRTSSSPLYLTTVRAALDRLRPGLKTLDVLESSAMSSTTSAPSLTDQYIIPYIWDNLESLSVSALSDNLLRHIVSLPGLRILKVSKLLRPGTNATPVTNGFSALGSLQVGSDVFSDMECILRLLPSNNELKSLQWSTFNCTTLSDRRGALQLVQRFCNPLKLSSLTLGEGISCDEPAEEPVDMDLDQDIDLSPLLGFRNLQNLALTLEAPVFIAPGDVTKLATAWPNLQHLNLCSSLYTSYIPRIKHIDVVALASSLPLLQTLGLRFDATEVNGNEPQAHPSLRLRTLSVGASPICSPSRVAAFIDRQFPNLHHLGIYYSDRPSNPAEHSMLDTRWQAVYDAWYELASRNREDYNSEPRARLQGRVETLTRAALKGAARSAKNLHALSLSPPPPLHSKARIAGLNHLCPSYTAPTCVFHIRCSRSLLAMTACLYILEVLRLIYNELDQEDALPLAMTCKAFLEPGLDRIWSYVDWLAPLIACLPEGLWARRAVKSSTVLDFCREPTMKDMERYLVYYAPRIRHISLQFWNGMEMLSLTALQTLQITTQYQLGALSPLLRKFSWFDVGDVDFVLGEEYRQQLAGFMPLFLAPTVDDLTFNLDLDDSALDKASVKFWLTHTEPRLKALTIVDSDSFEEILLAHSWDKLESLIIIHNVSISPSVLTHVSFLPRLRNLEIYPLSQSLDVKAEVSPKAKQSKFVALRRFKVQSDFDVAGDFLQRLHPDNALQALIWSMRRTASREESDELLAEIRRHCNPHTLKTVQLQDCASVEEEPMDLPQLQTDISPLFVFENVLEVNVSLSHGISLTPEVLLRLASAWPRIERLSLGEIHSNTRVVQIDHMHLLKLVKDLPDSTEQGLQVKRGLMD
ncbi:hypothetical protein NMY22_g14818 [Coprinellus aureogranulatus]|nr:hypothetical protein NMY22_g14818 [Coprinellus aureogranulatus]